MRIVAICLAIAAALVGLSSAMAQAPNASPCQNVAPSRAVKEASAALEQDPAVLAARFKLADALTDQECYDEAVQVLEAGAALHPQNAALEARLRSARSMMSEQRYIEGITRAEESARLQRNLLRCKKLGDLAACDEALSSRRNDWELLVAKGDALAQQDRAAEALSAYQRAAALNPPNIALQARIGRLEAQRHARTSPLPPSPSAIAPRTDLPAVNSRVAAAAKPKPSVYSNEAPAGRTN